MHITIDIDPASLSSAQQRITAFRQHRIIPNPKVVKGMLAIIRAVAPHRDAVRKFLDSRDPRFGIAISCTYFFAFPKSATKKVQATWYEGMPVTSARWGDCDNRIKANNDAFVKSGIIPDDHFVTDLRVRKVHTFRKPHIEVEFLIDTGVNHDPQILPKLLE